MANTVAPYGFKPVQYAWGTSYDGRCRPYIALSSYATALYKGDPVVITGTSNSTAIRGFQPGILPTINRATAGADNAITGVIVGFLPLSGAESLVYGAASTDRIALVADNPDLLFAIQDDASGTLAVTDVGNNANFVTSTSGSNFTGLSGVQLDATTPATTANFQLTIISLYDIPGNDVGLSAQWLVRINRHTYAPGNLGTTV
jgi:hypothetical protein